VVELEITAAGGGIEPVAGGQARFRFRIRDSTAGAPLVGLRPAAWLGLRDPAEPASEGLCRRKARTFLSGSLFSQAELDLNSYHVLMLNEEPLLTAVDPEFGFGTSRRVAQLTLPSPAFDWTVRSDQRRVFLSLPDSDGLASLDTGSWTLQTLKGGESSWRRPERLALQPDGHYLWVAVGGGVAAFTTEPLAFAAILETHPDQASVPSALAFSADGRLLFVAQQGSKQLGVIETARLIRRPALDLPGQPVSMAWSALAQRLYVTLADEEGAAEGRIVVVDGEPAVVGGVAVPPGPGLIRFAGDGRWGILLHPQARGLSILDAARNRIIQIAHLDGVPDQIAFSSELAYLRLRDRTELLMVPLAVLGREGKPIPTFDTVGGDHGFVDGFRPTPAAGIVQVPSGDGVLIANPGDHTVYFYKEGMAAPMGQLDNGGRSPRAVLAIDRSLREIDAPGSYETVVPLPEAGTYDVVFFLDSPHIVHCFPMRIASPPGKEES
jgi:hypothetical protein